jgi:hypothetical protein
MTHATKRLLTDDRRELVLDLIDKDRADMEHGDGRLVARVPLQYSDLQLARDETWWRGVRAGELEPCLEAHTLRIIPGKDHGRGRLAGYSIELSHGKQRFRRHFNIESLAAVARRKMLELVAQETANLEDSYSYYLAAVPADGDAAADEPQRIKVRSEPLVFEQAPLSDFLARSAPLFGKSAPPENSDDAPMPVFVNDEVWEEGRELARRGGENESAALISGRLLRDTDSPEVFVLLDACLEAEHAVEKKLSVTFTGETWARTRELLDLRRKRLNRPHEIIVGSLHGHNFLPEADSTGRRTCEACTVAKYCSRSTAAPSSDDFEWHRSVFAGQPWATLLIHGYTAREEQDFRLYTVENAQFKEFTPRRLLS